MPQPEKLNPEKLNTFDINTLNSLSDNSSEVQKEKAADMLNNMLAWFEKLKQIAVKDKDNEDYFINTAGNTINSSETPEELKKNLNELNSKTDVIDKENVSLLWSVQKPSIISVGGSMLARGFLSKSVIAADASGNSTPEAEAVYYLKFVEPFMANNGKLFKSIVSNYAHSIGKEYAELESIANKLYNNEKKYIDNYFLDKPKVKEEIDKQKNAAVRKEEEELSFDDSADNIIPENENIDINENKYDDPDELHRQNDLDEKFIANMNKSVKVLKHKRQQADYKAQLYQEGGFGVNTPRYEEAVSNFKSTKILAMGPESTEHSLLNESIKDIAEFAKENKLLESIVQVYGKPVEEKVSAYAAEVLKLETMSRRATIYIDLKTQNGLPNTPAGKDRLLGAYALRDNANDILKRMSNDTNGAGLGKNLDELRKNPAFQKAMLKEVSDKIMQIKQFAKKDPVREIEERYLLAQQAALTIKVSKDAAYKDLKGNFKSMNVKELTDHLSHDKSFQAAIDYRLKVSNRSGVAMSNISDLLTTFQTNRTLAEGNKEAGPNNHSENKIDTKKSTMKFGL